MSSREDIGHFLPNRFLQDGDRLYDTKKVVNNDIIILKWLRDNTTDHREMIIQEDTNWNDLKNLSVYYFASLKGPNAPDIKQMGSNQGIVLTLSAHSGDKFQFAFTGNGAAFRSMHSEWYYIGHGIPANVDVSQLLDQETFDKETDSILGNYYDKDDILDILSDYVQKADFNHFKNWAGGQIASNVHNINSDTAEIHDVSYAAGANSANMFRLTHSGVKPNASTYPIATYSHSSDSCSVVSSSLNPDGTEGSVYANASNNASESAQEVEDTHVEASMIPTLGAIYGKNQKDAWNADDGDFDYDFDLGSKGDTFLTSSDYPATQYPVIPMASAGAINTPLSIDQDGGIHVQAGHKYMIEAKAYDVNSHQVTGGMIGFADKAVLPPDPNESPDPNPNNAWPYIGYGNIQTITGPEKQETVNESDQDGTYNATAQPTGQTSQQLVNILYPHTLHRELSDDIRIAFEPLRDETLYLISTWVPNVEYQMNLGQFIPKFKYLPLKSAISNSVSSIDTQLSSESTGIDGLMDNAAELGQSISANSASDASMNSQISTNQASNYTENSTEDGKLYSLTNQANNLSTSADNNYKDNRSFANSISASANGASFSASQSESVNAQNISENTSNITNNANNISSQSNELTELENGAFNSNAINNIVTQLIADGYVFSEANNATNAQNASRNNTKTIYIYPDSDGD